MNSATLTEALVLVPALAAVILACVPARGLTRIISTMALLGQSLLAVVVCLGPTDQSPALGTGWLPVLGSRIHLAVDGIVGIGLLTLTAALVMAVIAERKLQARGDSRGRLTLIFVAAAALHLLLLSRDVLVAAAAHGTAGLALAALLGLGSGLAGQSAARRFANHAVAGTILFSAAAALLAAGAESTMLDDLSGIEPLQTRLAAVLLALAVGLQIPLPPLHTWLAPVASAGSISGRVLILGGWCTAGGFGLLRFGLGLFPDMLAYAAPVPMILGLATLSYAALLAVVQAETDLLRRLSWVTVGTGGMVLMGVASLDETSVLGAWWLAGTQAVPRVGTLLLACWIAASDARGPRVAAVWVLLVVTTVAVPASGVFPGLLLTVAGMASTVGVVVALVASAAMAFAMLAPAAALAGVRVSSPWPAALTRVLAGVVVLALLTGMFPASVTTLPRADIAQWLERTVADAEEGAQ